MRTSRSRSVWTLMIVLSLTTGILAQEGGENRREGREGRGGPREGRGPGGFGGGPGGGMRGGRGGMGAQSILQVAGNPAVQKELGLKPEQIDKLRELGQEFQREAREAMSSAGVDFLALRDLPDEERRAKMEELQKKAADMQRQLTTKFKPKLFEILDKAQQERAQQITWQAARAQLYEDPEIIKLLNIDKDQQAKIAAVNKEFNGKMRELFGNMDREEMTKLRESHESKLAEVLTATQKEQLAKLKGKEFDVAQLRMRGGRGQGRGPDGGGPDASGRPQRRRGADAEKKAEDKKPEEKSSEK